MLTPALQVAIDLAIARGQSLFQVAQAIVLICLWSFTAARWVRVFIYFTLMSVSDDHICSDLLRCASPTCYTIASHSDLTRNRSGSTLVWQRVYLHLLASTTFAPSKRTTTGAGATVHRT